MDGTADETELLRKNQMRVHILRNPEKVADIKSIKINNMMPFEIEWLFGWNSELGLLNIAKKETQNDYLLQTFFVSDHVGVILEYDTKTKSTKMETLTGHRNCICSFDAHSNGNLLVTADKGKESMIIVWDYSSRSPVFTALSPFEMGIAIVKFSMDFKHLITVSVVDNGEQIIGLWNLELGAEKPTCTTKLDNSFGPIIHLACSCDHPNFYCFTTENLIFFMTLSIQEEKNEFMISIPKYYPKKLKYDYTQSTYLTSVRQVVSASTAGLVTVWDDTDYKTSKIINSPITNDKQFLKTIELDNYSITTIICQKDYIITGNANGDVFFYNKSLCVLYHLNAFVGDFITSIMMHDIKTIDIEKGTKSCKIFHVDIPKNKFIQISEKFGVEPITALEVHPIEFYMVLGNSIGRLDVYDYKLKILIASYTNSHGETINNSPITSIKYSPNGMYLYIIAQLLKNPMTDCPTIKIIKF